VLVQINAKKRRKRPIINLLFTARRQDACERRIDPEQRLTAAKPIEIGSCTVV
jgi:hypothetical protein